jgi:hypothetical protein
MPGMATPVAVAVAVNVASNTETLGALVLVTAIPTVFVPRKFPRAMALVPALAFNKTGELNVPFALP